MNYINSQPNLNQMLVTWVDAIRQEPDVVREWVRAAVEEVVGRRVFPGLMIWPQGPEQVANRRTLTLVVLRSEYTWGRDEAGQKRVQTFADTLRS